jgi:hypothetical protein
MNLGEFRKQTESYPDDYLINIVPNYIMNIVAPPAPEPVNADSSTKADAA